MGINAFTRGMRSVNPKAEVKVIWVNSWFDPGRSAKRPTRCISQGADVRDASHRLDRRRAGRRSEEGVRVRLPLRHVEVRPERAAHRGDAPLGRRTTRRSAQTALDGKWKPDNVWGGIKDGMIKLAPFNKVVPQDVAGPGQEGGGGHRRGQAASVHRARSRTTPARSALAAGKTIDRRRAARRWTTTSRACRASCRRSRLLRRSASLVGLLQLCGSGFSLTRHRGRLKPAPQG